MENQLVQSVEADSRIEDAPLNIEKQKKFPSFILLLAFVVFLLISLFFVYRYFLSKNQETGIQLPQIFNKTDLTVQKNFFLNWINCSDVRSVIEEGNNLYAACFGGILVIDKNSGKVVDQIGESDGLGNAIATSLIKKGSILYIGTQDGITIFDLETRKVQKISTEEGLINGSNMLLREDEGKIWVGTFNGVSLLDTKSNLVKNYTSELADNSTHFSIADILVTGNSVYFIIIANSYSPGSVTRYDKATDSWERFGPSSFGITGPYPRIDFFNIFEFQNKIYLGGHNDFWVSDNQKGSVWKKISSLSSGSFSGYKNFLGNDEKDFYLSLGNKVYKYTPEDDNLELYYDGETLWSGFISSNNKKAWFITKDPKDPYSWISFFDIKTKQVGQVNLQNRPKDFIKLLALIDNSPIILSGNSFVWKYDPKNKIFETLFAGSLSDFDQANLYFEPVLNTSKILLFWQNCGMGCATPEFLVIDYADKSFTALILPEDFKNKFVGEMSTYSLGFGNVSFVWKDPEKKTYAFEYSPKDNLKEYLMVDLDLNAIRIVNELPEGGEELYDKICDRSFSFLDNGNKFDVDNCYDTIQNNGLSWKIENNKIIETENKTGKENELILEEAKDPYNPFGDKTKRRYRGILSLENKVYIWGNLGLNILDTETGKWKLVDTNEGLLSNQVLDVLVGDNGLVWIMDGSRIDVSVGLSLISNNLN